MEPTLPSNHIIIAFNIYNLLPLLETLQLVVEIWSL